MSAPLLLAATLLLGQTDAGYVRSMTTDGQHCLRWPVTGPSRSTVTIAQSSMGDPAVGSGAFDAIDASRQTWAAQMQVCGSLDLVEGAQSSSRAIGYTRGGSNENLVLFRLRDCTAVVPPGDPCQGMNSCGNAYDCWDYGAGVLALTTTTFTVSDGVLVDADIEINGATASPSVGVPVRNDVQNTITHELGHLLGLAHSPDPLSTMYASAPSGETSKRVLDPGTKQFVCDVYPVGLDSRDCLLTDGGTAGDGGTGGTTGDGGSGGTGGIPGGPTGPGIGGSASGCQATSGPAALRSSFLALCLGALLRRGARTRR